MLVLGTPKHLELGLKLQNWPFALHFNFCRFLAEKNDQKQPKKAKKWKSAKISPNDAKRSIQKPILTFLGNFGSVQVALVISFRRKCHFLREIFKNEDRDFLHPGTRSPRTPPPPFVSNFAEKKLTPIFFWKLNLWLPKRILHLVPLKNLFF